MVEIKRKDGSVIKTIQADSLIDANLRGADMRWANLRGADMQGADMRWANLRDADMRGANLQGANMRDADMRGANLLQCKQYVAVIRASQHSIVVIDDDISIGCQRMTLAEWLERFEAVGREAGYAEPRIAEYGIYLRAIRDVLESRKHGTTNE
jgi:hypothetical protein